MAEYAPASEELFCTGWRNVHSTGRRLVAGWAWGRPRECPSVAGRQALVEVFSEQVGYLKEQLDSPTEQLKEHRRIIADLTQRIAELEPPTPSKRLRRSRQEAHSAPGRGPSERPCPSA